MPVDIKDRIRLSLKSPYLWMIRGVIGLSGVLFTWWMFALLPLSELVIQTWFDHIFKSRLESEDSSQLAAREAEQLRILSKDDRTWYQGVTNAIRQIKEGLTDPAYRNQIDFDALAKSFYSRLVNLRRVQEAEKETQENALAQEIRKQEKALDAETDAKVRDTMSERLSLLKQRLDLKQKISARTRQMEVQLKLVEDQVLLLRDSALSTGVHEGDHVLVGARDSERNVGESIEVLSRQLQICSELDDEMQTMLRSPSRMRVKEG